jgi:hypothetical protein
MVTVSHRSSSSSANSNNNTSISNVNGYRPLPLSTSSSSPSSSLAAVATTNPTQAQFNPRLILSQIIALQSFHYVVLGIIFQINHLLFATSITLDRIFTSKFLDIWSALGWIDNAAVLTSSIIGYVCEHCLNFWHGAHSSPRTIGDTRISSFCVFFCRTFHSSDPAII